MESLSKKQGIPSLGRCLSNLPKSKTVKGADSIDSITSITKIELKPDTKKLDMSKLEVISGESVNLNAKGGILILEVDLALIDGLGLSEDKPQCWTVDLPSTAWSCIPNTGSNVLSFDVVISVPPTDTENATIDFVYNLVVSSGDNCFSKEFVIQQPIKFLPNAPLSLSTSVKEILNQSELKVA